MFSTITTSKTPEMVNYNLSPAIIAIAGKKTKLKNQYLDAGKQDSFVKLSK